MSSDVQEKVQYTPVAADEELATENEGLVKIVTTSPSLKMTQQKNNRKFLYIAACAGNLAAFTCGTSFGWTSPVLPKLEDNTTLSYLPQPITETESSWIASLLPLGAALGPIAAGIAADKIGRKKTLICSVAPFIAAFLMSANATRVITFFVARFLCGLGVGGVFTVLPMYIGEIAEDKVRGALGSFMQLFITIGLLFSYCIGPYVEISTFNYICIASPTIFLVYFTLKIPESPHYLLASSDETGAERSLMQIRCKNKSEVAKELEEIKKTVDESMKNKGTFLDIFKSTGLKKALILSVGLVALQQLSGINVILFNTQNIFKATGSSIEAAISTIIVGVVQVLSSGLTPILVDRMGKRFLLLISAIGMALSEGVLGYFFYLQTHGGTVDAISWLPVLCLVVYIITYCLGFGPLPWAVMGELFPADVKSAASTATASGCWLLGFVLTQFFAPVSMAIGMAASFWTFTGCCAFGVFFVYKFLPETTGKSLQEIQNILNGNTK